VALMESPTTRGSLEVCIGTTNEHTSAVVRRAGLEFLYIGMLPEFAATLSLDAITEQATMVNSPPPHCYC